MSNFDSLNSNLLGPEIIKRSAELIGRINGNPALLNQADPKDLADLLEAGRAMINSEDKENFNLRAILNAILRNQSIGAIASKAYLQAVQDFLDGKPVDDQFVVTLPGTEHKVLEESAEEVSPEEQLANLISELAAHIEFQSEIDPNLIDQRTRSSLEKARIKFDETNPNSALMDLVDYVGRRLQKPDLQEGTRQYYLDTLLPKIAEMYGFRQDQ